MGFKEYHDIEHTFVIIHNTGCGVMESPIKRVGVVGSCETEEEAKLKCTELLVANNSLERVQSTWCENTYSYDINTCTELGKQLIAEFDLKFNKMISDAEKNKGDYKWIETPYGTLILKRNLEFDN